MHELSVTQHILDIALAHAQAPQIERISSIHLVIGQLATIVDDCVQFYWDMISAGTIAEGAALHFERIPARLYCEDCHHSYALDDSQLVCPRCGSSTVVLVAGEEFYVESIEVGQ
jgi:hydrogenase nickel incorporation protein HypA/HybF